MIEQVPEIISPDYQAVYAALARRVAAAHAFAKTEDYLSVIDELCEAMRVIEAVENPVVFIKSINLAG
jgi:hypothetical protein